MPGRVDLDSRDPLFKFYSDPEMDGGMEGWMDGRTEQPTKEKTPSLTISTPLPFLP